MDERIKWASHRRQCGCDHPRSRMRLSQSIPLPTPNPPGGQMLEAYCSRDFFRPCREAGKMDNQSEDLAVVTILPRMIRARQYPLCHAQRSACGALVIVVVTAARSSGFSCVVVRAGIGLKTEA